MTLAEAEAEYAAKLAGYNADDVSYVDLAYANDTVLVARGTPVHELPLGEYRRRRLSDWPVLLAARFGREIPDNPFLPAAQQDYDQRGREWQPFWLDAGEGVADRYVIVFPWNPTDGYYARSALPGDLWPDGSGKKIEAVHPSEMPLVSEP